MNQDKKFHATPSMLRKLHEEFGPGSQDVHFDYDDFQYRFMRLTVVERIVDSLIHKIRNNYSFTIIADDKDFLADLPELYNLNDYYSNSNQDNPHIQKIIQLLNDISKKRDDLLQDHQNIKFLVFIKQIFNSSCRALKKSLNDRMELGLYYHEKFTFLGKLFESLKQQIKQAEDLYNELNQIILINSSSDQNEEEEEDNGDEDEQESVIEKFITDFKRSLCSNEEEEEVQE